MFLFSYTAAVLSVVLLVFSLVILFKIKGGNLGIFLALYMLAVAIWIGANAGADVSYTNQPLIFWSGLAVVGASFFISFYLCFVESFIYERPPKKFNIFLYILPSILLSLFGFSHYSVVETFFPLNSPAQIIPGSLYYFYLLFLFGGLFYGNIRLALSYSHASAQKKKQILYIELGSIAIFFGDAIFSVILPLQGELRFFTAGPQFTIFTIMLTAYAIFRHKLLDIKVAIQRGLIFSTLLICIISFYLSVLFTAQSTLFGSSHIAYLVSAILTCIVGIFSVSRIDALLRRLTDKIFFKDKYDSAKVLQDLSETLSTSLALDELVRKTTMILEKKLKIKFVYIDFFASDLPDPVRELKILENRYNSDLMLPLEKNGHIVGTMFFGPKLSGDEYTDEDINLFKTLAHQMALAFERSELYEQVKDYSKNLENKIEERTMELKHLQEKQSQELFDIAHELQTPLTIIKGEIHNLAKNTSLVTGRSQKEKTEHLEKNIDKVSNFINSLLKLARMDFINSLAMTRLNLSDLLLDLAEEFAIIAQESKVIFYYRIESGIFVNGDKNKLTELITNLVSNAMKYIANAREVSINLEKTVSMAQLTITDTGVGIPAEDLPHLFERFYRGQKEQGSGTGLGLAICKKIISLHNGEIKIKSQAGKGTTMEVLLPLIEKSS
jgi:signal transduction histidine kinase